MKIRIWGAQGSMPTPLKPDAVKEKIIQVILGMPDLDTNDSDVVRAYVENLPPLLRGTAKGNTSCVQVQTGGETFIIDAGTGIRELGLELLKGPCGRGQGQLHILFSHPHWDHIQGFPLFLPAFIPGNQITIYSIHDLELALTEQQRYLFFPVSIDSAQAEQELTQMETGIRQRYGFIPTMQAQLQFVRLEAGKPFSIGPVNINTNRNHHPGDAYSYRFEDQHSIFVYGGDAEYKDLDANTFQERVSFFNNADAVLFDAQYGLRDSWENKVDYGHSSAMIGVDFARRAGVKKLLLTHHEPTYSDQQLQEIQDTATAYQSQDANLPTCEIIIAYEGLEIDLAPPGAVGVRLLPDEEAAVITPSSVFDEQGVAQLMAQLTDLTHADTQLGSIVDLSQVERLSTASLKTLVTFSRQREGDPVVLAAPSTRVQEVISLGGYGNYFAIYTTVKEAVKAIQAREALNLPGQTINNRYQIAEILGKSAMGTVLKVIDQTNQHEVTLRIISPAFGEETIGRFVGQVPRLLDFDHRHIAQVYECNRSEEGNNAFIVEELLVGPTLFERLTEYTEPLAVAEAMDLAVDLMQALEYAHSRGGIHGNLKPQDIFLTEMGVKVSGFNLGRLEEGRKLLAAPALYVQATHLAPEQILGQPLDVRTDLYALGVILYQMFTGKLPFAGADREVMQAHLAQAATPPREHNANISRSMGHLVMKLLAKNPNERYASVRQTLQISSSLMSDTGQPGQPGRQILLGRTQQLHTLRERWLEAEAGRGQLVFISGEPGIGKTSLALQMARQSEAPIVLVGQCQEQEGRLAYQPFSQALQAYVTMVPPEISDPEIRRWLSHFSHLVPELKQIVPDLPVPAELEPQQAQLRLMSSMTQFIKRATQGRSWFLLLDDLQWIDEGSVELLRYLARQIPEMSLMIVGTYRDTEVGSDHLLQKVLRDLGQSSEFRQLSLDRLDQTDVTQLLGHLWDPGVPESLTETIYIHTEGNPLYVEEVAKGLLDDGLVTMRAGEWHFPEIETIRLPPSVYDAVERRIHYLNAETREVLSEAAVLGPAFRFTDVVAMSGLSEWTVLDHLDLALERQLVQEVGGSETLRFRHAEIHHVIYNDLGMLRQRRLHHRAGEAIEQRAQPEPERLADALAHHFSAAGELERALVYSMPAAQQAKQAYANDSALRWYERTLEMLDQLGLEEGSPLAAMQLSVYRDIGEIFKLTGNYDAALVQFASARALLESPPITPEETHQLADLCRLTADVYYRKGEYDTGLQWIEKGLSYLDDKEATIELANIYSVGIILYGRKDRFDDALNWTQKGLAVASQLNTQEGKTALAWIYYHSGYLFWRRNDYHQAKQYFQTCLDIHKQSDNSFGQSGAFNALGMIYGKLGNWDQAHDMYVQGEALAKEIGAIPYQGVFLNNRGFLDLRRGDWDQAMSHFEQSLSISQQLGEQLAEANNLSNIATLHIYRENWSEARQALTRSQTIFTKIQSDEFIPYVERQWAKLYLKTDELTQASDHINRSIHLSVAISSPLEEGLSRRVLGQIHQARDEEDLAEVQLRHSLQILDNLDSIYDLSKTKLALASLLMKSSKLADAKGFLYQAINTFKNLGAKVDLAEAKRLAETHGFDIQG